MQLDVFPSITQISVCVQIAVIRTVDKHNKLCARITGIVVRCTGQTGNLNGGERQLVFVRQFCPWLRDRNYTLILQPQSAGQELRRWLGEHGFSIECEQLVQDGKFLYTVLRTHPGEGTILSPGAQYVSPWLRQSGSPLLGAYMQRIETALRRSVEGLMGAEHQRPERLAYYRQALEEVEEMRKNDENGTGNL